MRLETLPNIDINIKCGNSLISRFALDADLRLALRKHQWSIAAYRDAVHVYQEAESKDEKRRMEQLMTDMKRNFRTEIGLNDPKVKRLSKLQGELYTLRNQQVLFEESAKECKARQQQEAKLETEIIKLSAEIEEIKQNAIYANAFEWRFEFPEALDEHGDFVGFDVVIGNPPYVQLQKMKAESAYFEQQSFSTFIRTGDLYELFYERGWQILKDDGILCFISSNKWMRANYGQKLRNFFMTNGSILQLIDFGDTPLFENAATYTNILLFEKNSHSKCTCQVFDLSRERVTDENFTSSLDALYNRYQPLFTPEQYLIVREEELRIKRKVEQQGISLKNWNIEIYRGILTGFNDAFIIDGAKRAQLIAADPKSAEIIKPLLRGKDIKRYCIDFQDVWVINSHNGVKEKQIPPINVPQDFPAIYEHLKQFQSACEKRADQGDHWTNLRNCAYLEKFEQEKLIYGESSKEFQCVIDYEGMYLNKTLFFIVGEYLHFLAAFLNSRLFTFCFKDEFPDLQGDSRSFMKEILLKIPIKKPSSDANVTFSQLVIQTQNTKKQGHDTCALEAEIDRLVYALYGLSAEEIALVEGNL